MNDDLTIDDLATLADTGKLPSFSVTAYGKRPIRWWVILGVWVGVVLYVASKRG